MRRITLVSIVLVLAGCGKDDYDMDNFNKMYGSGTEDAVVLIEKVSNMKVYFGHQSVGGNILGGIDAWKNETGVSLEVVESREFSSVSNVPFIHFRIGRNGDLRGKVDDFVSLMDQVPLEENPVAFFKFCYADVTSETEVESEYAYFKEKMIYLKDRYPEIQFLVCTVPYTGVQVGLRALAKKVIGRTPYGVLENIKRQEFNQRILGDLKDMLPVFDLAGLESIRPDGSNETYVFKGETYPCLPDYYRTDYGHLNDFGARAISYNLLAFLAEEVK